MAPGNRQTLSALQDPERRPPVLREALPASVVNHFLQTEIGLDQDQVLGEFGDCTPGSGQGQPWHCGWRFYPSCRRVPHRASDDRSRPHHFIVGGRNRCVRPYLPRAVLQGFMEWMGETPPSLYWWTDDMGVTHEIWQGEGGEQGHPFMPFHALAANIALSCT